MRRTYHCVTSNILHVCIKYQCIQSAFAEYTQSQLLSLKNKVKSCEYTSVDDMVRDKFVFSIQDLTVKERLLREEKLTLEKAISMARAAEASKEQIKVMNARAQSSEANQSVNVLRYDANQGKGQIGSCREKTKSEKCGFCGMVHALRSCPAFGNSKHATIVRRQDILSVCVERSNDNVTLDREK